jgi:hypothetical protein
VSTCVPILAKLFQATQPLERVFNLAPLRRAYGQASQVAHLEKTQMQRSIESLKREARQLEKKTGFSHSKALDLVAIDQGFDNWSLLMKSRANYIGRVLRRETVEEVIRLAEQKSLADLAWSKKHGLEDGLRGNTFTAKELLDHLQSDERTELYVYVRVLTKDERLELMALMWLGRGDSGEKASDWEMLVKHARGMGDEEDTPYICSKAPLARYLRDGLKRLAAG